MLKNKKLIVIITVVIIFTGLFLRYFNRAPKRHYSDFRVYYATADKFIAKEDIYKREDESITPFKYSPMFAMLISPLAFFSIQEASLIFFTLNFVLVVISIFLSLSIIVKEKIPYRHKLLLCVFSAVFTFRFILHTLDAGQVGIIVFALVLGGFYLLEKKKDALSASLIGLASMVKYMPLVILPYFLFRRKFKLVIFIVLFLILYCLLPAAYLGLAKEAEYLKTWIPSICQTSFDAGSWYDGKNQSFFSMILRFFTEASPYGIQVGSLTFNQGLFLAILFGVIIYFLIILPEKNFDFNIPVEYSLLFIFMILFNPNAWAHNFSVFIFVSMTLLYYLFRVHFRDKLTIALGIFSFTLMTLTSELFIGDRLETICEELSLVTIGILILVFLLVRIKLGKPYSARRLNE